MPEDALKYATFILDSSTADSADSTFSSNYQLVINSAAKGLDMENYSEYGRGIVDRKRARKLGDTDFARAAAKNVETLRNEIETLNAELSQKYQELEIRSDELRQKNTQLEEKNAMVQQQDQNIAEQRKNLEQVMQAGRELEAKMQQTQQALNQKVGEYDELQNVTQGLQADRQRLEALSAQLREANEGLQREQDQLSQQLRQSRSAVSETEEKLSNVETSLGEKEEEIGTLETRVQETEGRLSAATDALSAISVKLAEAAAIQADAVTEQYVMNAWRVVSEAMLRSKTFWVTFFQRKRVGSDALDSIKDILIRHIRTRVIYTNVTNSIFDTTIDAINAALKFLDERSSQALELVEKRGAVQSQKEAWNKLPEEFVNEIYRQADRYKDKFGDANQSSLSDLRRLAQESGMYQGTVYTGALFSMLYPEKRSQFEAYIRQASQRPQGGEPIMTSSPEMENARAGRGSDRNADAGAADQPSAKRRAGRR